jgi:4-amino-4-deoxy-L-arabinose transferase-like glycosyltransferase
MVESGDLLVPKFQGAPFFDKPIFAYWLMAGAFEVLGPSAGAARLVSVLAALGVVLATAWLGRQLFAPRVAVAGAAVLATTLTFVSFGRLAMSDMLLTLFTTTAVAIGVRIVKGAEEPVPMRLGLALGAALGLGFATKGPVAWLMAGIPILLPAWPRRRAVFASPFALAAGGIALVLLSFGWFAALYARLGAEPLAYFFLKENLERFAGEAYDVGRPFWYYPPAYLLTGLPWSLFLVPALWRARGDDGARLLASWIGLALIPLSVSRGKLDYYLLPLYPAIALLVGRWLTVVPWSRFDRVWTRASLVVLGAAAGALVFVPDRLDPSFLPSPAACQALATIGAAAALVCFSLAVRPSPGRVLWALAGTAGALGLLLASAFLPAFRDAQPNQALAEDVRRERAHEPRARVVACSDPARVERDVLFEARVTVERRCDLWDVAPSDTPFLLLLRPEEHASLSAIPGFREVARYRYLEAATLTLSGFLSPRPPALVILAANFGTRDPVAESRRKKKRKQELRAESEPDSD